MGDKVFMRFSTMGKPLDEFWKLNKQKLKNKHYIYVVKLPQDDQNTRGRATRSNYRAIYKIGKSESGNRLSDYINMHSNLKGYEPTIHYVKTIVKRTDSQQGTERVRMVENNLHRLLKPYKTQGGGNEQFLVNADEIKEALRDPSLSKVSEYTEKRQSRRKLRMPSELKQYCDECTKTCKSAEALQSKPIKNLK